MESTNPFNTLRYEAGRFLRMEIAGWKLRWFIRKHRGVPDHWLGKVCLRCGVQAPCPPACTAIRRFRDSTKEAR